jgi:hypothetical protein
MNSSDERRSITVPVSESKSRHAVIPTAADALAADKRRRWDPFIGLGLGCR